MSLSWLWDPHAVAKFQRFCGKERVPLQVAASEGEHVAHASTAQNGGLARRHLSSHADNQSNGRTANGHADSRSGVNGSANGKEAVSSTNGIGTQEETKIVHRYPVLKFLFAVASLVGEEEFFIAFLPVMFWNFDFFVGRRVVLLWFVALYLGTALKDVIQWDRPDPKIVLREANDEHCMEFGMPSTHTASGSIITMGLIYVSYLRYEFSLLPAVMVAIPLILCMGVSRVYSGHHTPLDVLGAIGLVSSIMLASSVFLEPLDTLYMTPSFVGPLSALVTGFLCVKFYPHPAIIRTSSKDMPTIIAVFLGFYLGLWMSVGVLNPSDDRHLEPFQLPSPSQDELIAGVLRYISGVLLLLAVRMVLKPTSIKFFSRYADVTKGPAKEQLPVVIRYRLVTYGGTCMACTALGPLWFRFLGIPVQTP